MKKTFIVLAVALMLVLLGIYEGIIIYARAIQIGDRIQKLE